MKIFDATAKDFVPTDELRAYAKTALAAGLFFELGGGAGDFIIKLQLINFYGTLNSLTGDQKVFMTSFSHNPNALELFMHHPRHDRIVALKAPNRCWNDLELRRRCGLPEKVYARPYGQEQRLEIYPAPEDVAFIDELPKKYAVLAMSASAGTRDPRTFWPEIAKDLVATLLTNSDVVPVLTGRHYLEAHAEFDATALDTSVISAVDKLTLSGTVEAMRRAEFTIVCNSFGAVASWAMHKPTFYMCHQPHLDAHQINGPVKPYGFFHGAFNHPLNTIGTFQTYKRDSFVGFLRDGGWLTTTD